MVKQARAFSRLPEGRFLPTEARIADQCLPNCDDSVTKILA
jgi:hypothetical protein